MMPLLVGTLALTAACSSAPRGPSSVLDGSGVDVGVLRPPLLPFESVPGLSEIAVPRLPLLTPVLPGTDPLADAGHHYRVQLRLTSEGEVELLSVRQGAGSARASLGEGSDVVVSLIGRDGAVLARAGLREPLRWRVYPRRGVRGDRVDRGDDRDAARRHGMRGVAQSSVQVFLPFDPAAARIEVRLDGDKGRLVAEHRFE